MAAPVTLDSSGDGARLPIYITSSCSSELIGLISLCFCAIESVAIIFQAMPPQACLIPRPFPPSVFDHLQHTARDQKLEPGTAWERGYPQIACNNEIRSNC